MSLPPRRNSQYVYLNDHRNQSQALDIVGRFTYYSLYSCSSNMSHGVTFIYKLLISIQKTFQIKLWDFYNSENSFVYYLKRMSQMWSGTWTWDAVLDLSAYFPLQSDCVYHSVKIFSLGIFHYYIYYIILFFNVPCFYFN